MGATVFCQPLEMRIGDVKGFDMRQANRWQWRRDYEGLQLADCRHPRYYCSLVALCNTVHVLAFLPLLYPCQHLRPQSLWLAAQADAKEGYWLLSKRMVYALPFHVLAAVKFLRHATTG